MRHPSLWIHFAIAIALLLTSCVKGEPHELVAETITQIYVTTPAPIQVTREVLTPTGIPQVTPVLTVSMNIGTPTPGFMPAPISSTPLPTSTTGLQPTPTMQEATTVCVERSSTDMVGTTSLVNNKITYLNPVIGIELTYPDDLSLFEDQFLFESYGFTLMSAENSEALVFRGSWLYGLPAEQLESRVQEIMGAFPNVPIRRENLVVGQQPAIMLSPVPGVSPTIFIYVAANDRLYEFIFGQEALDDESKAILSSIRFLEPGLSLDCLGLPSAEHVPKDIPQGDDAPK